MPGALKWEQERCAAVAAVASASLLARRIQKGYARVTSIAKDDASPVTVADFAIQALVVSRLHDAFPHDRFIAEESSHELRNDNALLESVVNAIQDVAAETGTQPLSSQQVLDAIDTCAYDGAHAQRTWVLDPIDGTRGFIAMRQYCIALALTERGVVQLGVLGCPNLPACNMAGKVLSPVGCVFNAVKGEGSYMLTNGQIDASDVNNIPHGVRISVSDVADPIWSTFCESVEVKHSSHELSARVASILGVAAPPVRMDSQAKYGCMARGDASIFLRFPKHGYVENVWDHAAGSIVIEEAGGKVTDGRGRPLNFALGRKLDNDDGIVASNRLVHDAVIAAVQQALRASRAEKM